MRRPIIILGALGTALIIGALLWLLIAPGQLVKYPSDLNKTVTAEGTATIYTDPNSGTPASTPQQLAIKIQRNLKVVTSTGERATVQETSSEQVGKTDPMQILQRYVIDRSTMRSLADPQAYAYTAENVTDRSPAYAINLPFDTSGGPYSLFKNETGTAYAFRRSGADIERFGLTLIPLSGSMADVPITAAYQKQLALPSALTVDQLAPLLKSAGVDPAVLSEQVLPRLSAADRRAVTKLLATPVPVKYSVSADTRLLVEPKTGAIVSLDRIDQVLTAAPDVSGLAALGTILGKPQYAGDEAVQGALTALKALPTGATRAMRLSYGQTDASAADMAAYVKDQIASIKLVELWIPAVLTVLGLIALGASAIVAARHRTKAVV
jgi:hypothetical protein